MSGQAPLVSGRPKAWQLSHRTLTQILATAVGWTVTLQKGNSRGWKPSTLLRQESSSEEVLCRQSVPVPGSSRRPRHTARTQRGGACQGARSSCRQRRLATKSRERKGEKFLNDGVNATHRDKDLPVASCSRASEPQDPASNTCGITGLTATLETKRLDLVT
jgi:hypothetical protein